MDDIFQMEKKSETAEDQGAEKQDCTSRLVLLNGNLSFD